MDPLLAAFLSILGGFLAGSTGFWIYLRRRYEHKDHVEALIMALAHDKIISLGIQYLEKGWINEDEFNDLFKYFWEPYCALHGNGSTQRIIRLVEMLPLRPEQREYPEIRVVADATHQGANRVIDELQKGDTKFERSDRKRRDEREHNGPSSTR